MIYRSIDCYIRWFLLEYDRKYSIPSISTFSSGKVVSTAKVKASRGSALNPRWVHSISKRFNSSSFHHEGRATKMYGGKVIVLTFQFK